MFPDVFSARGRLTRRWANVGQGVATLSGWGCGRFARVEPADHCGGVGL
jgi:hypothetical protein